MFNVVFFIFYENLKKKLVLFGFSQDYITHILHKIFAIINKVNLYFVNKNHVKSKAI